MVAARSAGVPIRNPGWSTKLHHRQVERVAQVGEARQLLRAVRVERAARVLGIGGEHADGIAMKTREAGDERAAPRAADLEERSAIDHWPDERARIVRPRGGSGA